MEEALWIENKFDANVWNMTWWICIVVNKGSIGVACDDDNKWIHNGGQWETITAKEHGCWAVEWW